MCGYVPRQEHVHRLTSRRGKGSRKREKPVQLIATRIGCGELIPQSFTEVCGLLVYTYTVELRQIISIIDNSVVPEPANGEQNHRPTLQELHQTQVFFFYKEKAAVRMMVLRYNSGKTQVRNTNVARTDSECIYELFWQ